jgi:transcriptional regulator with XRE-family HTH domain
MSAKLSAEQLLAHNLRRLLEERQMKEADFAKAIGMPGLPYIRAMNVRGDYLGEHPKWPKPARLTAMAEALGVSRSELLREPAECDGDGAVEES